MRVEPDGPIPCYLAIFGEAPGYEEQLAGRGFVGKSGQQLWSDMQRFAGLQRSDFYVSNVLKTGLPNNRKPKPGEIAQAMPEFLDELQAVKPRVVVTAGGFATRAMLGDVKMSDVHGIPHAVEIAGCMYVCHPIYHPAAGLHKKGFLAAFAYDLDRLNAFLKRQISPWAPPTLPTMASWLSRDAARLCEALPAPVVGLDTEGWIDRPWGLSFSPDGLHGLVIRAADRAGLDWFRRWLNHAGKPHPVVMHNGIHDLPVLRAMGISVDTYDDTQVLAYHDMIRTGSGVLEAESQNLGTLAYRALGLRLDELSEIPGVDFDAQIIPYTDLVMQYAARDAIATRRLLDVLDPIRKTVPYQIDMGQVDLVEQMIANGIPFEVDASLAYYADVLDKLDACTTDLKRMAAQYGTRDFNPGSHPQVRELIIRKIGLRVRKRTKGGLASTNEKALADHQHDPFVKRLQDHRELVKLRGTYVAPLIEELLN